MNNPHDLLPVKHPSTFDPSEEQSDYFYQNVIKPLIPDFIRIMNNYLTIDWTEVENLRKTIDNVLEVVENTLAENKIIKEFQEYQYPIKFKEYQDEVFKSKRTVDYYIKEYKESNVVHRTYLVNSILSHIGLEELKKDKWTIKDVKALYAYSGDPMIAKIIDKKFRPTDTIVKEAMMNLAKDKVAIWNKVRDDKVASVEYETILPKFNPGSSKQKQELFEYLGIEPLATSKDTGLPSWGRPQIEELFYMTEDESLKEVLQMFIDYSFSAIIKNNFLESFDAFTLDDRLYSNLKLFGTKTFRPTGNSPNLLQMPSTGSIYAKPLKKCFIAPEGYVVATIDYSALEDRVIANLSGDENKLAVFTEGLDGHSLAATYYFPNRVEKVIGKFTDNKEASKKLKVLVDKKDSIAKEIRQNSKPVTFGISYGAYPPKIAATIKCPIKEAEDIFDSYHNKMYPDITKLREKILYKAKQDGYVHLGLGCRLYASDVEKSSRTLFNAVSQFWSILTLLSINKLHQAIDNAGLAEDIKVTTSIYDSIYLIVKKDVKTIQWLNETLVPIMEKDFLENQIVHNSANLEIGDSWANLFELKHNASEEEINKILKEIK